jgi:AraC-like DNA-binding protein
LHDLFGRISQKLHSSPQLSLEELSLDIQIERHTIERAVRAGAGTTFRDFRKRGRLNAAQKALRENPDLSLKEVAYTLGYRSLSAFSRFIKDSTGCSASELRSQGAARALAGNEAPACQVFTAILKSGDD